jgi:hypothetical protein
MSSSRKAKYSFITVALPQVAGIRQIRIFVEEHLKINSMLQGIKKSVVMSVTVHHDYDFGI